MKVRCKTCKNYVERDEALRTGVMSFCDSECLGKYQRKANKKKPKRSPMPQEVRMAVMGRDLQRCCFCGDRHGLVVHHVRYLSEGGKHQLDNLVTLCDKHHLLVHSDKNVYQPLLLELLNRRALGDSQTLASQLVVEFTA